MGVERVGNMVNNMSHRPGRQAQARRLGDVLIQAGIVTPDAIERALSIQRRNGGRLGSILVNLNLCSNEQLGQVLHEQYNTEVVNLNTITPNPDLLSLISPELIRKHEIIPLKIEDGRLWVAMVDPYNLIAIDDIRFRSEIPRIAVATCTERDFRRFVELHLESQGVLRNVLKSGEVYNQAIKHLQLADGSDNEEKGADIELRVASSASPIVTLCNYLLVEAIRERASDIHIEPFEQTLQVRMRVDGRLRRIVEPPRNLHSAIVARFKVMSSLDITKRRIPQDGQLSVSHNQETVHFRVSTLPTIFGEKCVIRLLRNDATLASLEQLGLEADEQGQLKKLLKMPQGLILVTGPTGSGKTTTLHAALNYISNPEINIVTLEDPVEVTLPGISHVPIHQHGGVTFASGLRSILRQDPDVIFVGEMRDSEVSAIAIRAAQTGHLVLSTLHTNSAVDSLTRLVDMGIPPYLVAGSLLAVIAQRLVRRLCSHCAASTPLSPDEAALLRLSGERLADTRIRAPLGCSSCNGSGYRGRIAVYEVVIVSREIRELIRSGADAGEILDCACRQGNRTLLEAGIRRMLRGETSAAEVIRVLMTEQ
jgi:type IV pilus assembly protein PilB